MGPDIVAGSGEEWRCDVIFGVMSIRCQENWTRYYRKVSSSRIDNTKSGKSQFITCPKALGYNMYVLINYIKYAIREKNNIGIVKQNG